MLKIYREPRNPIEKNVKQERDQEKYKLREALKVEIFDEGRKEQIKRKILFEVVKKIC